MIKGLLDFEMKTQKIVLSFLISLTLCLVEVQFGFTQSSNFTTYSVDDGLIQSQVVDIYQDKEGNLWFATFGGVSKFNGKSFQNYTTRDGLPANMLRAMVHDQHGNFWFATDGGGISKFNGTFFENLTSENGLGSNLVMALDLDNEGNLWVGTWGAGLSKLTYTYSDTEERPNITFQNYLKKDGLVDEDVNTILVDKNNNIWVGTNNGLSIYDPAATKTGGTNFYNYTTEDGLPGKVIRTLFEDKTGNIWIGTSKGLCISNFDHNSKKLSLSYEFTEQNGLVHNKIFSILQDHDGDVWVGTYSGISKIIVNQDNTFEISNYTTENGLSNNFIRKIFEDREGNIWIGTDGSGLCRFSGNRFVSYTTQNGLAGVVVMSIYNDSKGNKWFGYYGNGVSKFGIDANGNNTIEHFTKKDGLVGDYVWTITEDKDGKIWIGTNSGVTVINSNDESLLSNKGTAKQHVEFQNYTINDGLISNLVRTIIQDSNGDMWMGTRGGVSHFNGSDFINYTSENGLLSNVVWSMIEDKDGIFWFASFKGITQYDPEKNQFNYYTEENGLVRNCVWNINEDAEGNIWFGTEAGISKIEYHSKQNPKFNNFTIQDGLHSNSVNLLAIDNQGHVWAGTADGIDKVIFNEDGSIDEVKHYGKLEGFVHIETNQNSVCIDDNGAIWFGTINGAIKFNPEEDIINEVAPITRISDIRIFYREEELPEDNVFPFNKNHLTFNYIGVSLSIPENVRYQYKLSGFENDWSPITKETFATYSNIPSGDYLFLVRACNNDRTWNSEPVSYSFSIVTPFWKTWWFYNICGLVVVLSVWGFIRYRITSVESQKRNLEEKVADHIKELKISEEKYRTLIQNMNEGLLVVDNYDVIQFVNERFCEMIGYTEAELIGEVTSELLLSNENKKVIDQRLADNRNSKTEQYEIQISKKTGEKLWLLISASPVLDSGGNIIGSLGIHTDITTRKTAEDIVQGKNSELQQKNKEIEKEKEKVEMANVALKEAYDKLMTLEEFKESMTETIVHDLKNPLNNIIGLSKKVPNKDEADIINQAGLQMLNMVLNILDVQKFEDTKVMLDVKSFSVSLALQDALRQVKVLVKQKGLKINDQIDPKYQCKFDYDIITRVLVNFLTNSIKYSPSFGEIKIQAVPVSVNKKEFLQISVTDQGVGIPKDKIDQVFDKFSVLGSKTSEQIHSTGLGLYFCKTMIENHSGNIWVESNKDEGTVFYFTLPREVDIKIEDIEQDFVNLNGDSGVMLNSDERKILEPYIQSFLKVQVYETSKTLDVLKEIDKFDNESIKQWKQQMELAIFNCDEEKYVELLSI
ncbi:MAG: PAS domain S-box protein [Bacteroidia bacterium]|nr:PAS domain S-box protein [Bacteroidia bacterium]